MELSGSITSVKQHVFVRGGERRLAVEEAVEVVRVQLVDGTRSLIGKDTVFPVIFRTFRYIFEGLILRIRHCFFVPNVHYMASDNGLDPELVFVVLVDDR